MSKAEQPSPEEVWEVGPLYDQKLGWPMPSEEFPVDEVVNVEFVEPDGLSQGAD